jgi:hypothetical protein
MIKNILAVAIVVALSACSSGSDNDDDNGDNGTNNPTDGGGVDTGNNGNNGGNGGTVTPVDTPVGGGDGPVAGSKAGVYTGTLGEEQGVFVINNENELSGLAIRADNSALSYFGSLGEGDTFTGGLRLYGHQESVTNETLPLGDSFGAVASLNSASFQIDINIVAGQTIDSVSEELAAVQLTPPTAGELIPATAAALAGDWTAVHTFCGLENCFPLTTNLNFTGVQVTGETIVTNLAGEDVVTGTIAGGITEFGDVSLVEFSWNGAIYSGLAFFNSADNRLVFVGENDGNVDSNFTIAGIFSQ